MEHAFFLDIDDQGRMTLNGHPLPGRPDDAVAVLRAAINTDPATPWMFGGGMSLPQLYTRHPVARELSRAIRGFALPAHEVGPAIEQVIKAARIKAESATIRLPGDTGMRVHAELVNGHQVWAAVQGEGKPRVWVNGHTADLETAAAFVRIPASQIFLWKVNDHRYAVTARYTPDGVVMSQGKLTRGRYGWEVEDVLGRRVEAPQGLSLIAARDALVWHHRDRFPKDAASAGEGRLSLPDEPEARHAAQGPQPG